MLRNIYSNELLLTAHDYGVQQAMLAPQEPLVPRGYAMLAVRYFSKAA